MYLFNFDNPDSEKNYFVTNWHLDVSCPLHAHYCMETVYVRDGSLIMQVGDSKRVIHAGECTFIMPFEPHSFETPKNSHCLVIEFSPEIVPDFYGVAKDKTLAIGVCTLSPSVKKMCDDMLPLSIPSGEAIEAKAVVYPLCAEIMKKCGFKNQKIQYGGTVFTEAIRFIMKNFQSGDVSLSAAARALGVHHVYLSRAFREKCQMTYTRYVNSVRASYARLLLSKGEKSISQIALDSGFGSIRNFNREFKRVYGITPNECLGQIIK